MKLVSLSRHHGETGDHYLCLFSVLSLYLTNEINVSRQFFHRFAPEKICHCPGAEQGRCSG